MPRTGHLFGWLIGVVVGTAIGIAIITRVPPLAKLVFGAPAQ